MVTIPSPSMNEMKRHSFIPGFTLIELLIVVAIIGILAAIAVPNFQNAQIRAKIARTHADLRSVKTALESYQVDNNRYPPDAVEAHVSFTLFQHFRPLTTPIAYMASVPEDEFFSAKTAEDPSGQGYVSLDSPTHTYFYASIGWIKSAKKQPEEFVGPWTAYSVGPDQIYSYGEWIFFRANLTGHNSYSYDGSNGINSRGDIAIW